jgi:nitrate/TMAO reductase-like tetraheme cytochrome c subunit
MSRFLILSSLLLILVVLVASGSVAYALSLENRNEFCASCHTQPEVTYYQRVLQSPPTDLTSAHVAKQVRCIDCHSGAGAFGRLEGLRQGARDLAAYVTNNYRQPAITTHPLPDANCLKCHDKIFETQSLKNHYHFYLRAWQQKEPQTAAQCVTCHTSHSQGKSLTVKFAVEGKFNAVCHACHEFSKIR